MRTKKGTVISSKMNKTIVVSVNSQRAHPKYKKLLTTSKKFYADSPENKFKEGDQVTIYETRPLSKLKRWTVVPPLTKP
ncbi:MAG: 30S ribosomal protein S17 [Candidatus Gracilibacteria bacterium]